MDRQVRPLQVLNQADARGLVLHQHHVYQLPIFALAVDRLVLLNDLGAQVGVLEVLVPAVQHHDAHAAVHGLEHAERDAPGRIVEGLVGRGAVVALEDELELGEALVAWPQAEPVPLDDTALLGVDDLGV